MYRDWIAIAVLICAAGCVRAEDGVEVAGSWPLRVESVPADAVIALVDGGKGVVARQEGGILSFPMATSGLEVWVGKRDHDLWREPVGARRHIVARLVPASSHATLRTTALQGVSPPLSVHVAQTVEWRSAGFGGRSPFSFSSRSSLATSLDVPTPKGFSTRALLHSDDQLVAPPHVDLLKPGAVVEIHAEPARSVHIPLGEAEPATETFVDAMFLAYDTPPPPQSVVQDAIQWWMARPQWGKAFLFPDHIELRGLPPAPVHVFLRHRTKALYLRVRAEETRASLVDAPVRFLRSTPRIDGAPAPEGTKLLPGALDVLTATNLVARDPEGVYWRDARVTAEQPIELPLWTQRKFTLLTPAGELAYGRWMDEAAVQSAETAAGALNLVFGSPSDAEVSVRPSWPRSGLRAMPGEGSWRKYADATEAHVGGLPLGTYQIVVRWRPRGNSAPSEVDLTVSLTSEAPVTTIPVAPPSSGR